MAEKKCDNRSISILEEFYERVKAVLDQLTGEMESREVESFDSTQYWSKFDLLISSLHKEVTMTSVMLTNEEPPDPDSLSSLMNRLSGCMLQLVSLRYGLPKNQGLMLAGVWHSFYLDVFTELQSLADLYITRQVKEIPPVVGKIWSLCDSTKTTSRNNADCLVVKLNQQLELIEDALAELNQARSESSREENFSSCENPEYELEILQTGIGVVKVGRSLTSKLISSCKKNGKCSSDSSIKELDDMNICTEILSERVDDYSLTLYPPVNKTEIKSELELITQTYNNILDKYRTSHIKGELDDSAVALLEKAIEHNYNKVSQLIT